MVQKLITSHDINTSSNKECQGHWLVQGKPGGSKVTTWHLGHVRLTRETSVFTSGPNPTIRMSYQLMGRHVIIHTYSINKWLRKVYRDTEALSILSSLKSFNTYIWPQRGRQVEQGTPTAQYEQRETLKDLNMNN